MTRPFDSGRPVLTTAQVEQLMRRIISMTSADTAMIMVTHTARAVTRLANDHVRSTEDVDELVINIYTQFGNRIGVLIQSNQLSDTSLRALVQRCEAVARAQMGSRERLVHQTQVQDTYLPVALWHEPTVEAMHKGCTPAAQTIVDGVTSAGLRAAGFIGLMARAEGVLTKEGIISVSEETDCEVTVTARGQDGKSSGWDGQAARNWSAIDVGNITARAVRMAQMSQGAQAVEPGRRTAILGPAAVAQIARWFTYQFSAYSTDRGATGFSKTKGSGNKLGQRVFDPRVMMLSNPADADGGYPSYFATGYAAPSMTWVDGGVLKNLAYDPGYAMGKGKAYADLPWSIRIGGGDSSIEAMIAKCPDGIYVNRFSSVEMLDMRSGMTTGFTRDGCFLIRNNKIDRPVKNFRFLDSPFFFLNRLVALGPTARAPLGYTPPAPGESDTMSWPRRPIIVPPMMVQDFNFAALADAV